MNKNSKKKMIPLQFERRPDVDMRHRASELLEEHRTRRSVRHFSSDPIPLDVVESCIEAACQAPSGANKQPWTFVLVTDPETKKKIREAAEEEERAFYGGRAGEKWLADLSHFETGPEKAFLEEAPALIVIFARRHGETKDDRHYYVSESVGLAAGMLIAGLHHVGLATLTHTPSPMGFLAKVLERPENERPYLLLPVGFPAQDCNVPNIERRSLDESLVRKA